MKKDLLFPITIIIILLTVLIPWLIHDGQVKAINHDIFWLTTSAGHLWQGWQIGAQIYEPNPPLSILLYLPVYGLNAVTGIGLEHSVLLCGLFVLLTSIVAVMGVLRAWAPVIDRWDRWFIGLTLLLAGTILATPHFGQRDQVLFFGLLPFLLLQLAVTEGKKIPSILKYGVIIAGAILMLLKPHYGVIPMLVVAHRMVIARKGWRVVLDEDVWIPVVIAGAYLAMIGWLFPGYGRIIFPDAMALYVMDDRKTAWGLVTLLAAIGGVAMVVAALLPIERERRSILLWVFMAALGSLAIFAIMHRNYMYQLLPALSFFVVGMGFGLYALLRRGMGPRAAMVEGLVIMALFCLVMRHSYYPSQQDIRAMPLTQRIDEACADRPECHFMLWSDSLRVTQLTARYSRAASGSRFPSLWFMSGLKTYPQLRAKYAGMMVEDMKVFAPTTIIACNEFGPDRDVFAKDAVFNREFAHYHRRGTVSVDIAAYETGHSVPDRPAESCDFYRRFR